MSPAPCPAPLDGAADTVAAHLALAPADPLRGPIVTLWDSDGVLPAWHEASGDLIRWQPPVVQLHTWEPGRVDDLILTAIPRAHLVLGCGVDGVARRVALGEWPVDRGRRQLVALARRAVEVGARAICWNAEASWKRPPGSEEARRLAAVIADTLASVASLYPQLRQWHTSYDHPHYHSTYPWRAWLGAGSPIEVSLPQVYAAPGGGMMAHRGALEAREARALSSWDTAIRRGWITPDDPTTPLREGVVWRPYYQLHHVTAVDTVASALAQPVVSLWAMRSRSDAAGREAAEVLCAVWRAGLWGDVRALQRAVGVADDGDYGPITHAAVLRWAAGP